MNFHRFRRLLALRCERSCRERAIKRQYLAPSHLRPQSDGASYRVKITWGDLCPLWVKSRHWEGETDVRFTPESGHWNSVVECPLCAKSGHTLLRQSMLLFDHLVGARQECRWHRKAERIGVLRL